MKLFRLFSRAALLAVLSFCSFGAIPAAFAAPQTPYVCSVAYTGAAIAANTTSTVTVACPGSVLGDVVSAAETANTGAFQVTAYVSAAGTVTINISNVSAGSLTPATGTWVVVGTHVYIPPLVIT